MSWLTGLVVSAAPPDIVFLDSITDAGASDVGKVGIAGSHGGLYAAAVASRAGLRAVALNDAGRGLEDAGVAGLAMLDDVGMAGVAVDVQSALIGDAQDTFQSGVVSYVNKTAIALGLTLKVPLSDQIDLLLAAETPKGVLEAPEEARWVEAVAGGEVLCVDSASLIKPEDAGRIIVTGSHGGLIGGDPARACKAQASVVFFNDAGGGKDGCGLTRLPALDQRGIGGVALHCASCRIGDAKSAFEGGVVYGANRMAEAFGIRPGMTVQDAVAHVLGNPAASSPAG